MRATLRLLALGSVASMLAAGAAQAAVELRFMCYGDGNECEVSRTILDGFEKANPDIKVTVDKVPYKAILESLPIQLAGGSAPDIARVTDLGGLHKYYLDLAPYVDKAYWEKNFGDTLDWFRAGPDDKGIYGMMTQLTITGPYINKTLFDQAGIAVPGPKATWQEWAEATSAVAKKTSTPFPMAMDRSGHRIAGPAISMGAKIFDADGNPALVDPGFETFVKMFVKWNQDGTMDKDVWAGKGGSAYQDAAQEFINGQLVFYYSGSWQVSRFDKAVGDAFDWQVVGSPCGPAACTGMPGGAAMVGFKQTKHPAEVAKVHRLFRPGRARTPSSWPSPTTCRPTRRWPSRRSTIRASRRRGRRRSRPGPGRCRPSRPSPTSIRAMRSTGRCSTRPCSASPRRSSAS